MVHTSVQIAKKEETADESIERDENNYAAGPCTYSYLKTIDVM